MRLLAMAAYMLMTAAEALPPEPTRVRPSSARQARVDSFDGRSLPDPWSGQPLFGSPTTLIAHVPHDKRFHLGFDTDTPRYGDCPHKLNARMEPWKNNWLI